MKLTSKKRKRLDKFIAAKMRKEEKARLIEKLSKTSQEISDRTELVSAATLGTGRAMRDAERIERMRSGKGKAEAFRVEEDEEDADLDERHERIRRAVERFAPGNEPTNDTKADEKPVKAITRPQPQESKPAPGSTAVGSALAQGADGKPAITMRKRQRKTICATEGQSLRDRIRARRFGERESNSDSSFDSSDSDDDDDVLHAEMQRRGISMENDVEEGEDEEESETDEEEKDEGDEDEDGEEEEEEDEDEDEEEGEEDEEGGVYEGGETHSKRRGIGESERSKGFKQWAMNAMDLNAADERPVEPVQGMVQRVGDLGPQDGRARGPLGQDVAPPAAKSAFAAKYFAEEAKGAYNVRHVNVVRSPEATAAREELPVVAEEDVIMRTILENAVTIVCGETGSGKTTQVPQFLYESGFGSAGSANPGMIGITQPRRVAAVSMSKRVGAELGLTENQVSYQIRYDASVSPQTRVKFMTDGVLLRELAQDLLLDKYSTVIVDEAHERSVNTDVLIGMLSRVVRLREQRWLRDGSRPLRLVIMSATLRVGDFVENATLFPTPPPVLHIAARQHPVAVHFNRRTVQDYVSETIKKASKIHTRLPPGGILIFLTGQQEVVTVCRKLAKRYSKQSISAKSRIAPSASVADVENEEIDLGTVDAPEVPDAEDGDFDPEALDSDNDSDETEMPLADSPMHILPLYSLLPNEEQQRVFEPPPEGHRLVVVATNVAETSITIPGITYVVDCGRAKERRTDPKSQVQSYDVAWISKASASQRAGRAGRTGPGHCYRLYSSAVYEEHFSEFSAPEILRTQIDGLVLQMKAMNIDNVANFPFPTPPDRSELRRAERSLVHLGALEHAQVTSGGRRVTQARVTSLGRSMALFPVVPRYAKLLAQGGQHGCMPYAVAIVAAMSVGDVFVREESLAFEIPDADDPAAAKEARRAARSRYYQAMRIFDALGEGMSDVFRLLSAVGAYEHAAATGAGSSFCERHFLRPKAMDEIHKLRAQLGNLVLASAQLSDRDERRVRDPQLSPPNDAQLKVLRQLIAAMYIDRVAVRADIVDAPEAEQGGPRGAKMASTRGVPYVALGVPGAVFVHPSSGFFHGPPPEWVVFGELHQSASKTAVDDVRRVWLKTLTRINPAWLPTLGKTLCTFSQPIEGTKSLSELAKGAAALRKGESASVRRAVTLVPRYGGAMEDGAAGGGIGWELPPVKVTQELRGGRWISV